MLKKALFLLLAFILIPGISHAEIITYIHTVKQSFGGSQSPDDARIAAFAKAKREALEQAGTYLESLTIVKNSVLEKDEIFALTAGVLKAEIVSQKNYATEDAFGIVVKAKVDVDTSILEERIRKLLKDRSLLEKYKENQKHEKKLLAKIKELERENQELKTLPAKEQKQQKEILKKQFREATQGLTASELMDKALGLVENGKLTDPDKALEYLNKAISLDPNYTAAYIVRGLTWRGKGNYDLAISDYNKAIELNPGYADAYCYRGITWSDKGNYDRAISNYNQAIKLNPGNAGTYSHRGITWAVKGNYAQAISDFNQAIKLNPNYANAYIGRGLAWHDKGNYAEAVSDYNNYLKINGNKDGIADQVRQKIRNLGYTPKY